MDIATFLALALACAPQVHPDTARALVAVESAFNPHAIGVVGGALVRQPRHRAEALATAKALQAAGWNFSVGLGADQRRATSTGLGLTLETAFDPCANLAAMQTVLTECFERAPSTTGTDAATVTLRRGPVLLLQRQLRHRLPPRLRAHGRAAAAAAYAPSRSNRPHRRRTS